MSLFSLWLVTRLGIYLGAAFLSGALFLAGAWVYAKFIV